MAAIEKLVEENETSYMDAVIHYCESNGIEIETAGTLIKNIPALRAKIQDEAEELHFLPKTAKLDL